MLCILQCFSRFTATPGGRCVEVEVGVGEGGAGVVPRTLPHLRAQEVVRDSRSSDATCSWLARQLKSFSCCCSPRGPAGGGSSLEWLRLVEVFFCFPRKLWLNPLKPPSASAIIAKEMIPTLCLQPPQLFLPLLRHWRKERRVEFVLVVVVF